MPYLGRFTISKQLLHKVWLASLECDVQTCRRDQTTPYTVKWCLPTAFPHLNVHLQFGHLSFVLSIHAPRIIPSTAKIWDALLDEDLDGLRALFETRQASVYDTDEEGDTVLGVSLRAFAEGAVM